MVSREVSRQERKTSKQLLRPFLLGTHVINTIATAQSALFPAMYLTRVNSILRIVLITVDSTTNVLASDKSTTNL